MSSIRERMKEKKRIVVKIGSSSLMHDNTGKLNLLKSKNWFVFWSILKIPEKTLYWYLPVQSPSEEMPSVCMTVPMIYP